MCRPEVEFVCQRLANHGVEGLVPRGWEKAHHNLESRAKQDQDIDLRMPGQPMA